MKSSYKTFGGIFLLLNLCFAGIAQYTENSFCKTHRKPAVAGKFYEADKTILKTDLDNYFKKAKGQKERNALAIIAPHAGYLFSGKVAASAYMQLSSDLSYERIFIIAPSHRMAFEGASIYKQGNYITPMGQVPVDCKLAEELIGHNEVFTFIPEAHKEEHAIEVQLPFLQQRLKEGYKIVPILIGTQNEKTIKKISDVLKRYLKPGNLFIISSDFSHFPEYNHAVDIDKKSAEVILKNSPEALLKYLRNNEDGQIKGLATCMCGRAAILCLLNMSSELKNVKFQLIDYNNSGDSPYGNKDKVVGYWAISLGQTSISGSDSQSMDFSENDKKALLAIARKSLLEYINNHRKSQVDTAVLSPFLKVKCGAFVTLTINGELRGCIGSFAENVPLWQVTREMAISASCNDPRFPKVKPEELKKIKIEISILSPMHKIDSISQIEIGKHGIYIVNGNRRGTLLPQVATANHWNAEQFVKYCATYKAGITNEELKNSEIYIYEAIVFKEND